MGEGQVKLVAEPELEFTLGLRAHSPGDPSGGSLQNLSLLNKRSTAVRI